MVKRKNNLPLSKLCKTRWPNEFLQHQPLHAHKNQSVENTLWSLTNLPSNDLGAKSVLGNVWRMEQPEMVEGNSWYRMNKTAKLFWGKRNPKFNESCVGLNPH